jgi:hypothetical protein
MATTSNTTGGRKPSTRKTTPRKSTRSTGARRSTRTTRSTRTAARARSTATAATPSTPLAQASQIAERAVLVPVGASLLARDNLVSTIQGLATKYSSRTGLSHEIRRYERRGTTARNRFERQVKRTRTRFERQLRQRRSLIERTIKQNRRRVEREVKSVRKDLTKQSGQLSARATKVVSDAQSLIAR